MMLTMVSITAAQISRRMMYVPTIPPAPGAGPPGPAPLPRSRVYGIRLVSAGAYFTPMPR
ncbi:hypothetical protein GCM10010116_48030 [Microbispora rosea subsp. aerata]|nr:hypothetical protein GCM10010116_48030 [Microbispora rosea subsp. aerata]GLJ84513.1 hypothetical protein GCM10017588_32410 [Microbispora rosea subsp. aerata]